MSHNDPDTDGRSGSAVPPHWSVLRPCSKRNCSECNQRCIELDNPYTIKMMRQFYVLFEDGLTFKDGLGLPDAQDPRVIFEYQYLMRSQLRGYRVPFTDAVDELEVQSNKCSRTEYLSKYPGK